MRLVIVTGFESSGSVFAARVISFVLGKCKNFGDWSGYGWNGNNGDNFIIIHRSMPYGRNPKRWLEDLEQETSTLQSYSREFVICTRDLNISKQSRLNRFGGSLVKYELDDKKASAIFNNLMRDEKCFILSYETALALGDAYYQTLFDWLDVDTKYSPIIFDANKPYIREISRMKLMVLLMKKFIKKILKNTI
jgi:hypothetical protein